MFSVFVPSESALKKLPAADPALLPDNAVWIDLLNPTMEEDRAVERLAGIAVPTREDMQEIEISSRLYIENGARYMTATLMCQSDTDMPKTTPVTFILAGHRLVTVRYDEPKPFALVEHKLARSCMPGISGEMVLMELLDAVIDRCADILERAGAEVDQVSHDIFEPESERHGQAKRYSQILIAIGRKGDLVSKIRESLVSIGRVVTFLSAVVEGAKWSKDMREQLKTMQRDDVALRSRASGSRQTRDGGRHLASAPGGFRGFGVEPAQAGGTGDGRVRRSGAGWACAYPAHRSLPLLLRCARL